MILNTITQTPALITPFDKEFEHCRARQTTLLKPQTTYTPQDQSYAPTTTDDPAFPDDLLAKLRAAVSFPGKVLTCRDGDEYEHAVCTGNLLYARKRPAAVVITDKPEELGVVVKLARKYNIELTVKNGGHSYAGYSLNCGGILVFINTGKLGPDGITVDLQSTPKTVTIPAGCLWSNVHDHFRERGYNEMVIGGRCPTVGVSGFTLGGGVSPFSRGYGLGIDTVLKMNIITASGDFIEVHREDTDPKKKDLFWALRGGGGGKLRYPHRVYCPTSRSRSQ
ncbi:hypothetical protein OPQ81_002279 [Rhizoctonia solani]|nr:hypothetical protein OPQ81_002279 [Rhizoctonia solani]